ncbi:MAG: serine hydrolase, partial [Gemmatimonadetes bacterium]|nr:serine hydrolase [Gemmatimonadota bacterium]
MGRRARSLRPPAFLLVFAAAVGAARLPAQNAAANARTAIDRYLQPLADATLLSGTVLVARGKTIVYERSFGRADDRAGIANAPGTQFAIASLTKVFTGIIARELVARGALRLDDPVARWIPDFPMGRGITVAQLMSHRAGVPHRVTQPADERRAQTAESMVRLVVRSGLAVPPESQRLYSSAGYSVLARVLELATGRSYAELLHELVLAPAGVTGARDATEPAPPGVSRAVGHFATPGKPTPADRKSLSFLVGAGSVWATAHDVYQVVQRVVDGGYGAAAAGARDASGTVQWMGFTNGFSAWVSHVPSTGVTLVVTTNLPTGAIDWIARDVPRIMAGEAVEAPRAPAVAPVALSRARREAIEGPYAFGGGEQRLEFISPSAALLGGEYLLVATAEDRLHAPQQLADYAVVPDSTGRVVSLRMDGPGGITIPRVRAVDTAVARAEVLAVVQRFFDAMRTKDTAGMRAVFEPGARFIGMRRRANGDTTLSIRSVSYFVEQVARDSLAWVERAWRPEVRIDRSLATVWAEYDFFIGGVFRGCGVDA